MAATFDVPGPFGVKGSTFAFANRRGKIITKTDSKYGKSFAIAVQRAAMAAGLERYPKHVGVIVAARYTFARPKGKDRHRPYPCVRPDADKLARALLDALTGIAYFDDGQVVGLSIRKVYGDEVRARIKVRADKTWSL